jgi:hypothetical protein
MLWGFRRAVIVSKVVSKGRATRPVVKKYGALSKDLKVMSQITHYP